MPDRAEAPPVDAPPAGGCRLVINADDFGRSPGANQAVRALHEEGVVTSTSLMVGAPAAADAVECARSRPGLAVGLHLTLVCGRPVLPPSEIPHLVGRDGEFMNNHVRAGILCTLHPAWRRELRRELEAQFAAFDALALGWSHVDTHLHFALTPSVLTAALDLARRYPVIAFRVPLDDWDLYRRIDPDDARKQRRLATAFQLLCRPYRRAVEAAGYLATPYCYGLFRTGRLDPPYLQRLIRELPDGDYELHCHPDRATGAGRAEYEALRSRLFRQALERRGVKLTTFKELAGS